MENYNYKCLECGFVHIVPAYWVSFSPDDEMLMPHINMETNEHCKNANLVLQT